MDAHVFGDTAVATGNIWIEGIWKGVPYSGQLAITATLIRSSSGWLMVAEHSSAVKQQ
jgi:ketosteroid isomerase-like protein